MSPRPPLPPFTRETAIQKVRIGRGRLEHARPAACRSPTPRTAAGETAPSSPSAAPQIVAFPTRKWARELDYRLIKELWAFDDNRIAVRFAYEWHDDSGQWFRSYGNENWEFDDHGLMRAAPRQHQRPRDRGSRPQIPWPPGPRPADHPGLSDLGL